MKLAWPLCLLAALTLSIASPALASEETFQFGRLGKIHLYHETARPKTMVLFVSGDGGWNLGVVDMARALASLDAMVAGIDITHYLHKLAVSPEKCYYPAGDLEQLAMYIQKKFDFTAYTSPVLVGYSSGATLVYAALVQAPAGTFQGAISLGFCPDLPLKKPLCRGNGLQWQPGPKGKGYSFLPARNLSEPWVAFQGEIDQVCSAEHVKIYVKKVNNGKIILLPKVGHGYSVQRNWMPQFRKAFTNLIARKRKVRPDPEPELKDLPLVEVPALGDQKDELAVMISGDGGWAGIDREMAKSLSTKGIPVVGLNSLDYFWQSRTPETASRDLSRIIKHYLAAWNKKRVVLLGYSLGAEVLPKMINLLTPETRERIALVALLAPGRQASFEFHLSYWLGGSAPAGESSPVLPEILKIEGPKILCLYGRSEKDSVCRDLHDQGKEAIELKGGHHFAGQYDKVSGIILARISSGTKR